MRLRGGCAPERNSVAGKQQPPFQLKEPISISKQLLKIKMITAKQPQASGSMPRSSLNSAVSTVHLDRARALLEASAKVTDGLSIAKAPEEFDKKMKELVDTEDTLGSALSMRETPIGIQKEVEAQIVRTRQFLSASRC